MRKSRLLALCLSLVLLASLIPVGVLASNEVIEISTADQLRTLSENCRLDTWSEGKTVVLKNDIDLSGVAFQPIPTFGGTFEGGGHTISGLYVSGVSATGGLFRYIQSTGLVRELNVEGVIAPSANGETFGGIAGENKGRIVNCSFSGSVSGRSDIGGIVGLNSAGGEISGCRSIALVSGEHYTGGIAGRNMGIISDCTNLGAVNTSNPEISESEFDIDWTQLNSTENISAHTDTGGIAGISLGKLENCTNRGNVGYPHVGYNVGGIVGRQSGFVDLCRNFGMVNGRKDVGGIAGQMEPNIELQFSTSVIAKLRAEMDALSKLIDNMIVDFQGSANNVSGILTNAGAYLDSAGRSASVIGDALVAFVDGNISSINNFTATIGKYLEELGGIVGHLEGCFGHFSSAMDALSEALEILQERGEEFAQAAACVQIAFERMQEAKELVSSAVTLCKNAYGEISSYFEALGNSSGEEDGNDIVTIPEGEQLEELEENLRGDYEEFSAVITSAMSKVKNARELLSQVPGKVESAVKDGVEPALELLSQTDLSGDEIVSSLQKAMEEMSSAGDDMSAMTGKLEVWLINLGRENNSILEGLGSDFLTEADRMDAALLGLSGEMQKLNKAVTGSANVMGEDLREINEQFFRVMERFMELIDSSNNEIAVYEDMSEEELFSEQNGKVQNCENRGSVEGDVNVGGLVGTMAIEYDLDPEEDISVSGTNSGSFRYFTNAALLGCINLEKVKAKKDAVGGAVGYMDLGIIYDCENYGEIESASGDYIGGIAGQSSATIRECWSLCVLRGRDYMGGIAGSACDMSGCRSIVQMHSTGGWKGMIAGELLGEASGNYFVGSGEGGIDGVSYAGIAEPQKYSDFVETDGLPEQFTDFKLTFATESSKIKSVSFSYGESLDISDIPPVPERAGYVGKWEDYDFSNLVFSDVVMAVYTPYDKVVATTERVGRRAVVLLEGAFLPGTVPTITPLEDAPEGCVEAWTVTVENSMEPGFTLRYLAPGEGEELQIFVLQNGKWNLTESEKDGSYILFEGSGDSVCFAAYEREKKFPLVQLVLCGAGAVMIVILLIVIKGKKRKALHLK